MYKTLYSLKKQSYPQNKIEILVIDGGSVDDTIKIAKKFRCKIYKNTKTELIYGKHIGFLQSTGRYLIFLDSDEMLENHDSLKLKLHAFQRREEVKAVFPTGYKTPKRFFSLNNYSNEFGEPFSFFIYRESKGCEFLLQGWSKKFKKIYEDRRCAIFDFSNEESLPIIELWAGGCAIDLEYVKKTLPVVTRKPELVAHLFYLLNKNRCLLAITKDDPTIHYSSENFTKYLKKIKSRIKNNVYGNDMGKAGFNGRDDFQPIKFRLKRYLFIFYSFSLLLPLYDAVGLAIARRRFVYLLHAPLSLYTAVLIIYHFILKRLGFSPVIKPYGS